MRQHGQDASERFGEDRAGQAHQAGERTVSVFPFSGHEEYLHVGGHEEYLHVGAQLTAPGQPGRSHPVRRTRMPIRPIRDRRAFRRAVPTAGTP